ncbi:MAG: nucleoside-triphosphatase, partial [Candidatus Auribacterota bacterium]|nr:nucleoside-triphosphatase [Candidatus Auribacterota bacterium]
KKWKRRRNRRYQKSLRRTRRQKKKRKRTEPKNPTRSSHPLRMRKRRKSKNNILITGYPGVGKTALVRQVIDELGLNPVGFYTEEIREGGKRAGFRIKSLTPGLPRMEGILARMGLDGPYRRGPYTINIRDMEEVGARALEEALTRRGLIVIDEIGNMEMVSRRFQEAVIDCLDSPRLVLGVIKAESGPFVNRIKPRLDVEIIELTRERYDEIKSDVMKKIRLRI